MSNIRRIIGVLAQNVYAPTSLNIPVLGYISKVYSHLKHVQTASHGEERDTVDSYLDDADNILGKIEDSIVELSRQNEWLELERAKVVEAFDATCDKFNLQIVLMIGDYIEVGKWFDTLNLPHTYIPGTNVFSIIFRKEDELAVKLRWHECIQG